MLDKIFSGAMADTSRFSVPGLIVMALGVALNAFAGTLSGGDERRGHLIRLGGLVIVMAGALIAVTVFG